MDNTQKIDCTFYVDWADSNTKMLSPDGEETEAGTALLLCNNIIFLKPLTNDQLSQLKEVVVSAVNHELSKRTL